MECTCGSVSYHLMNDLEFTPSWESYVLIKVLKGRKAFKKKKN